VYTDVQIVPIGQGGQVILQQMPQTQTFQIQGQGGQMQQVLSLFIYTICDS